MNDGRQRELVKHKGRTALADELYDLRCELGGVELGERIHTAEQYARMREGVAELESLVGEDLVTLLAAAEDSAS